MSLQLINIKTMILRIEHKYKQTVILDLLKELENKYQNAQVKDKSPREIKVLVLSLYQFVPFIFRFG